LLVVGQVLVGVDALAGGAGAGRLGGRRHAAAGGALHDLFAKLVSAM